MRLKGVSIVSLFIILLIVAFCRDAKAQVSIEAGPTLLSGDYAEGGALILSQRVTDQWEIHAGYISEQFVSTCDRRDCDFDIRENILVGGQRIVPLWRFNLGIGMDYFQNTNRALGKHLTFSLLVEYPFTDNISIRIRHMSNAGSGAPNLGQDMVTFAWTFTD